MAGEQWYVGVNGQQEGPLPTAQVIERIQAGSITPQHYVFGPGASTWTPIAQVAAFAPWFGGAVPPPPPPGAAVTHAHEIDFKVFGEDLQYVEITLDPGEACIAEAGAMMFMEPGIAMETIFGDGSQQSAQGGMWGAVLSAGKRVLTGESLFLTVFANNDPSQRRSLGFAAPYPGTIVPMDLAQLGGKIICQKDAFLCAAKGVSVGVEFQKKIGVGLFGGEGFILQKLEGDGLAFVHAGGVLMSRTLAAGETLRVDTGCVVAFEPTVKYDIQMQSGVKSILFGGEGLFLATLTGPGRCWVQSLPFSRLAGRIWAAAPQTGGARVGEGSVLGPLGDIVMGSR
ncbi:MAG: TIGR00266 family protein [Myxococcales bacterium]|nr:TIGR00266 family protein [Myxococcales bacterium]MCB9530216.1 TIGR00266 family protein [Myxococcales bacterium]MCB9533729.1 TIGR00266 family protein [Myxococcales bacterium]